MLFVIEYKKVFLKPRFYIVPYRRYYDEDNKNRDGNGENSKG